MPTPFEAVLLGLAAWRTWHLVAKDDITERPRTWALARLSEKWDDFIECPFCAGFWISLGWVGAFVLWDEGAVWAALPFALNSAVVFVNAWLSDRQG